LRHVLDAGLADHNEEMARRRDWRPLAVTVRDPDTGELAGGLLGRTSIGSQALRMAEVEAISRGCRAATLVTVNFQAPEFYLRHGWEEFGRIASAPGVERIFMCKTLVA
ncbi:MAG TPA: GNAT family N-acetyltransferase, partial [Acetobacteraceae bacterium]